MLQNIRERATGPVAWFIVALISVPFALFGINSYFTGGSRHELATVGGQTVTQYQFQQAYEQKLQQLRSTLGKQFDPDKLNQSAFRRRILQNLIDRAVLIQHAHDVGYQVSDKQVLNYLQQIPAFQEDGQFSPSRYRALLRRQGKKPAGFEALVRQDLMIQQMQGGVSNSAFAVHGDLARTFALARESRHIDYATFKPAAFMGQVQLDDKTIKAYYQSHKARYRTPERVKVKYLELSASRLASRQSAPSESALRKRYQQEKDARFTTQGAREVRHILIAAQQGDMASARKKAEQIRQQLVNGANFSQLARQKSDDKGSANDGGELGWVTKGVLPAGLQKAVFQLQPHKVSQPIRSSAGWHIVEVQDTRPGQVKPFSNPQVQQTLKKQYRRKRAQQQFAALSDKLAQLSFENPNNLAPVAKALDLRVQTSDWLTQNQNSNSGGLAQHPQVLEQVFSQKALNQRVTSKPVAVGSRHQIVFRVVDYQAAKQQSLAAVRQQVKQSAHKSAAARLAAQAAAGAKKALEKNDANLKTAVGDQADEVKSTTITRSDNQFNNKLLTAVFSMPRPALAGQGGDMRLVKLGGDGGVALVKLKSVSPGNVDKAKQSVQRRLRQRLAQQSSAEQFAAYTGWLRTQMSINVHANQLKRPGSG